MVRAEYVGKRKKVPFFKLTDVSPSNRPLQFWYQRITGKAGSPLLLRKTRSLLGSPYTEETFIHLHHLNKYSIH